MPPFQSSLASNSTTSMLGKRSRDKLATANGTSKRQKLSSKPSAADVQSLLSHQLPQSSPKVPSRKRLGDRAAGLTGAFSGVQRSNGTIISPHSRLTNGESQTQSFASTSSAPLLENTRKAEVDKRTLRSQDGGSRSKSELAQYFPNFDDIVSNDPKEAELLTADTRLYITEEPPQSPSGSSTFVLPSPGLRRQSTSSFTHISPKPLRTTPVPTPTTYQKLNFSHVRLSEIPSQAPTSTGSGRGKGAEAKISTNDPLPNSLYAKAHRRAERQEKQLRNIEKERAMHEKVQLERILDGLQGPDWLKVMGISGIVEGERKRWDDRRLYFVQEVKALLEKFRLWKEEERRRKVEKETSVRDEDESEEGGSDEDQEEDNSGQAGENGEAALPDSPSDPAARQLLSESLSASTSSRRFGRHRQPSKLLKPPSNLKSPVLPSPRLKRPTTALSSSFLDAPKHSTIQQPPKSHLLPAHDPTAKPFVSFFRKPHQRAAALDPKRRVGGRGRLAFGVALPEIVEEQEFALPQGFVSQAAMRIAARRSRLLKEEKMGARRKGV